MAFTSSTINHSFVNADGTPASGSVTCTLTQRMTNAGTTIVPAEITAQLNAQGQLSQLLVANTDPGTFPAGAQWRIDLRILGDDAQTYLISVPPGPGQVDLGTLLPQAQPVG